MWRCAQSKLAIVLHVMGMSSDFNGAHQHETDMNASVSPASLLN